MEIWKHCARGKEWKYGDWSSPRTKKQTYFNVPLCLLVCEYVRKSCGYSMIKKGKIYALRRNKFFLRIFVWRNGVVRLLCHQNVAIWTLNFFASYCSKHIVIKILILNFHIFLKKFEVKLWKIMMKTPSSFKNVLKFIIIIIRSFI